MKRFPYVFFSLFLCITSSLLSQDCPSGTVTLTSQQEVNDFVNTHSDCTIITGRLDITGDDITDLSGLSFLTRVVRGLHIHDAKSLTTLNGLQNITTYVGDIRLENLDTLTTLAGLNGMNLEVVRDLTIKDNKSLVDISALLGIHTIENGFKITNNESLISLKGLDWVQKIDNISWITENKSLVDCGAICNLIENNRLILRVDNPLASCHNILQITEACAGPTCEDQEITAYFRTGQVGDILFIDDYSYGHITGSALTIDIPGYRPIFGRNELVLPSGTHTLCLTVTNDCGGIHTACKKVYVPISSHGCQVHSSQYLDSQEAVENFARAHSNCPSYIGQLNISGADIKDLSSLSTLEKLDSDLYITNCDSLRTLKGLENLTYIRGSLSISHNDQLIDISALQNLDSIDHLSINANKSLSSLNGLQNIKKIARSVTIQNNIALKDCSAACPLLNNVSHAKSIDNPLANCQSVYNISEVYGCEYTPSRTLIDKDQDGYYSHIDPNDLNPCIPNNADSNCHCVTGDIRLTSQKAVDLYAELFGNCNTVEGNLIISGEDIISIDKLRFINSIQGDLEIESCPLLKSLNGLQNIHTIDGKLRILHMDNLIALTWLNGEKIGEIGGNLVIRYNKNLSDISSLLGLHTIDGHLMIGWNDVLNDLTGIDQIEYVARKVIISNNGSLKNCTAACYLLKEGVVNNGFVFEDNRAGCNNLTQVQKSCASSRNLIGTSVSNLTAIKDEKSLPSNRVPLSVTEKEDFKVFPNPSKGSCFVLLTASSKAQKISVLDVSGVLIKEILVSPEHLNSTILIDLNNYPPGLYFVQLKSMVGIQSRKVVLQ